MTVQQATTQSRAAVGWTLFAAVTMVLVGFWWILAGIVGLANSDFYVVTRNYLLRFDNTTWGWIHLVVGVLVALAGLWLFSGTTMARVGAVAMAFISALVGFSWIPWYPFWAILIVTASFFILWVLMTHGRDAKEPHGREATQR
jgi:hypothetical protein